MAEVPDRLQATLRVWGTSSEPLAEEECDAPDIEELDHCYLARLRQNAVSPVPRELLRDIGRELADILLPRAVRTVLLGLLSATDSPTAVLRLRLQIELPELASIPWEYAWLEDSGPSGQEIGFLALHPRFSLVRQANHRPSTATRVHLKPSDKLHLLAAWADPRSADHPALPHLTAELDVLRSLDQFSELRHFQVRELACATCENLRRFLNESPPHVLHFLGHGDRRLGESVLVLESGKQGMEERLRAETLAEWLRGKPTRLIVVSACWSGAACNGVAGAIAADGTAAVIAMQMPMSDAAAGPFARAFYSALAQACSVDEALRQARQMVKASGADWGVPVLYASGDLGSVIERAARNTPISIPYPRDPQFIGRDRLLAEVHRQLNEPGWRAVALVAMGGAGKTGVAAEYAHTRVEEYPGGVFWLNARDASVLTEEYAALSRFFDLPDEMPLDTRAARVRDRLEAETLPSLLVFDNLADEATRELLPSRGNGRILITTREERLVRNRAHVRFVPVLEEEAALSILQSGHPIDAVREPAEMEAARGIAAMVGNLPLALALAGQHVRRLGLTYAEYQQILRENRRAVLERARRDFIASTEHRGQIFDAIDIACRSIDTTATEVLATSACLGGGSFSPELLRRSCAHLSALDVKEAIATLTDRCLLTGEAEGRLAMHELVCLVAESVLPESDRPAILAKTASGLAGLLGEANDVMEWRNVRPELSHFRNVLRTCPERPSNEVSALVLRASADLHYQVGVYQFEHGDLATARKHILSSICLYGTDPSDSPCPTEHSLPAIRKLGELECHLGHSKAARKHVRTALNAAKKFLPANDCNRIEYYHSVGYVLKRQDKLRRALPFYARSLAMSRAIFGSRHPSVAMCANNLGTLYQAMRDMDRALSYLQEALDIYQSLYGPRHSTVAVNLNNVGRICREQGDFDTALARHEEALSIFTEAHGPHHTDVAASSLLAAEALLGHGSKSSRLRAKAYALSAEAILVRLYDVDHPLRIWVRRLLNELHG